MKNYPIVTVGDSKYLEPIQYLLHSIVDTYNGSERLKFYILHVDSEISEIEKDNFKSKFNLYNVDILFVTSPLLNSIVASGKFQEYTDKLFSYLHSINMARHALPNPKTLYKMWMSDCIEEDEVIFLDADTFLYSSIEHLFDIPSPKTKMAAVLDPWPLSWTMHKFPFDNKTPPDVNLFHRKYLPNLAQNKYRANFNGGVFITSLDYWREIDLHNKTLEYMDESIILYGDQDILNYVFDNNFNVLPLQFNCHFKSIVETRNVLNLNSECPELPVVIHFCGNFKPLFENVDSYTTYEGPKSKNVPNHYKNPILRRYRQIQKKQHVNELYLKILKRPADLVGLNRYAYSDMSLVEIQNILANSNEAKQLK